MAAWRDWLIKRLGGETRAADTGDASLASRIMQEAGAVRGIHDGVRYDLPLSISQETWSALPAESQQALLQEATSRQSLWFQFDTPQRSGLDAPVDMAVEDPLHEWSWTTRKYILERTHSAYHRNPIAKAAVDYSVAFVVGDGMNVACRNKAVEALLEEFRCDTDNPVADLERSMVRDLQIDGELFVRFHEAGGETVITTIKPWEVQWVETEPGMFRRPLVYHVQRIEYRGDSPKGTQTVTEDVPAEEMLHRAINRHSYELRGRSDLYTVLPWLRAYKEWLEDRARQNYWRNALLWWVSVDTTNAATIAAVSSRWRKPPTPGSVYVSSAKEQVQAVSSGVNAGDAADDGRQLKLMAAVGLRTPEYMLSDGENANLASTSSQEMPALTKFTEYQRVMTEIWTAIFQRVIDNAVSAGLLPDEVDEQNTLGEETGERIAARDAFTVSYEPPARDDMKTLADALLVANQSGWISDRTAASELGFDYDQEQRQIDTEHQMKRNAMARGEMPTPPGTVPDGYGGDPDDDGYDDRSDDDTPPEDGAGDVQDAVITGRRNGARDAVH